MTHQGISLVFFYCQNMIGDGKLPVTPQSGWSFVANRNKFHLVGEVISTAEWNDAQVPMLQALLRD